MTMVALATISSSAFAGGNDAASSQRAPAVRTIRIVDQNGRPDPGGQPSATSQIVDVTVGPGGSRTFSPSTVNISVGDTVKWTWQSDNHSVTSGSSCTADSQFCSPNDTSCPSGFLSNTGTVYQHTFGQAGTYSYYCAQHCASGMVGTVNVTAPCTDPPANMAAWYPGDGNGRDIAGGNNGALQNGTTFATGKVGQAFSFDGVDDIVQIHGRPSLDFAPTSPMTVDFWVYRTSTATIQHFIGKRVNCDPLNFNYQFALNTTNGQGLVFGGKSSTGGTEANSGQDLPLNTWTHLAGTFDGTTVRLYINGILAANATGTIGMPNTAPLIIGGSGSCQNFGGLIDEVEIYNRALSQPELAAIFNAGSAGKCKPPQPTGAFSRKVHGGAGTFDIDLMPLATAGVECRSGGASGIYQMIVQFANAVTVTSASVIGGTGSVSGFSVSGATVTVDLMNVANAQTIFVKLTGVNDGTLSGDVPVAMNVLVGDTSGNGSVNASDVSQTKLQSGQAVTGSNFRTDVTVNGSINAGDVSSVKSRSGTSLP